MGKGYQITEARALGEEMRVYSDRGEILKYMEGAVEVSSNHKNSMDEQCRTERPLLPGIRSSAISTNRLSSW